MAAFAGREAAPPGAHDGQSWFVLQRGYPTGRIPSSGVARACDARPRPASDHPHAAQPAGRSLDADRTARRSSWTGSCRTTAASPPLPRTRPTPTRSTSAPTAAASGARRTAARPGRRSPTASPVPAIASLVIDPRNPSLLYATTIHRTYPIRLLRSTDGGNSWTVTPVMTDRGELSPAACSVNVYKACIPPSSGRVFHRSVTMPDRPTTARSTSPARAISSGPTTAAERFEPFSHCPWIWISRARPRRPPIPRRSSCAMRRWIRRGRSGSYAAVAQPRCLDQPCSRAESTIRIYRSIDGGVEWIRQDVSSLGPYSLLNTRYADPGAVYVPRVRLAIAPSNPDVVVDGLPRRADREAARLPKHGCRRTVVRGLTANHQPHVAAGDCVFALRREHDLRGQQRRPSDHERRRELVGR